MTGKKLDLRNAIFHNDDKAREHLEAVLWPDGPVCPRCGVMGNRITKLRGKSTRPGVYNCKDCRSQFSVTVGTVSRTTYIFARQRCKIRKPAISRRSSIG